MKILLSSYSFAPVEGGIETVSRILAREFHRAGHEVAVVTSTAGESPDEGYKVYRNPSQIQLWNLTRRCDILFQSHISLKYIFPAILLKKPVAITCHTWVSWDTGKVNWTVRLKRYLMSRSHCIAISHAFTKFLPPASPVIFNPYEDFDFSRFRSTPKDADLVFMGRLVDNKGVDLLIQAVSRLKKQGVSPTLTVVGEGPERANLEAMCRELGIDGQVRFLGLLSGEQRGKEVARHKVMVVPSRWPEPFGLVALEGIASGCAIIGSANGGLRDAIGPCGLLFPNGDCEALQAAVARLLADPQLRMRFADAGPDHLISFQPATVAEKYIHEFERILSGQSGHSDDSFPARG